MLYLVRGLPGSGKSTYAKSLGIFHVEADMFFMHKGVYNFVPTLLGKAHNWCRNTALAAHEEGIDVVVANTFTRISEMEPYFVDNDVRVIECHGTWPSIHNVPSATIDRMKARWEPFAAQHIHQ